MKAHSNRMAVPIGRLIAEERWRRRRRALVEQYLMNAISLVILVALAIMIILYW